MEIKSSSLIVIKIIIMRIIVLKNVTKIENKITNGIAVWLQNYIECYNMECLLTC